MKEKNWHLNKYLIVQFVVWLQLCKWMASNVVMWLVVDKIGTDIFLEQIGFVWIVPIYGNLPDFLLMNSVWMVGVIIWIHISRSHETHLRHFLDKFAWKLCHRWCFVFISEFRIIAILKHLQIDFSQDYF
jgi:hypothetical protein